MSPSPTSDRLPVDTLRPQLLEALETGPVVLTSPTGSGKSTQVPRWCPGPVLVIEPRRVACRSLAQRVAALEGVQLGREVGYHVRDERRCSARSRIVFATPGIVLRMGQDLDRFASLLIDEYHERGLEVDLLLALLLERRRSGDLAANLGVMSATLDAEGLAEHLGGTHLHADGRTFPVSLEYLAGDALLPDVRGLESRLSRALQKVVDEGSARGSDPGSKCHDVLVFLPGKGEISSCTRAVRNLAGRLGGVDILPLHGGLSLAEQSRIFEPSRQRKVILATNVAETSLTVPGVGTVIDSGLVRQTRYARDRGFLTLVPIALDSAEQRKGRAGRVAPGHCIRLWSEAASLEARTAPELHRESLVPLVLAAATHGYQADSLPFVDPPKEHALSTARQELLALGALDSQHGKLTERGQRLFGLPLDAALGRLLVEAEEREKTDAGILEDMIDLVAALSLGRPLARPSDAEGLETAEDLETWADACDAVAAIRAIRGVAPKQGAGGPSAAGPRRGRQASIAEARATRRRLRTAFELEGRGPRAAAGGRAVNRRRLAFTLLAADRRLVHIARQRSGKKRGKDKLGGQRIAWSNGGTELELGRDSACSRALEGEELEPLHAIAVLQTLALGLGGRDTRLLATQAMPLELSWLVEAGLGQERLAQITLDKSGPTLRILARLERTYAKKIIDRREEVPQGEMAREAIARLFAESRLFPGQARQSRDNLEAVALAHRLVCKGRPGMRPDEDAPTWLQAVLLLYPDPPPSFEDWLRTRLRDLGVESGEDIALLSAEDLQFPPLPTELRAELDRAFPRQILVEGVTYRVEYDLDRSKVVLRVAEGKPQKLPSRFFLPRFPGFTIEIEHKGVLRHPQ